MRALSFYYSWLRACARCGRGLWWRTKPIDLYCEPCWQVIDRFRNRSFQLLQDSSGETLAKIWIYSLFTWTPASEPHVKPLVYALKQGGLPEASCRLAEAFSFEMSLAQDMVSLRGRLVFVIPPTRREQVNDHAWLWARALADIWGAEIWAGLETLHHNQPGSERSQKSKTRAERLEKEYVVRGAIPQGKFFIFVDDVMTSGATALAAWRALKEPHCFQVWVIAYRPKLAGFSGLC